MTERFSSPGMEFMRDLAANNTREWFQANKKRYERDFKLPGRALVAEVNEVLADISPDHITPPNRAISRINRDIRFSKDKTPYNTKLWAGFMDQTVAKGHSAGFYFGFDLHGLGIGCGAWMFPKEKLESLRGYFAATFDEYSAITASPAYEDYDPIAGEAYKRVPKPWPSDHPAAEMLKRKGLHTRRHFDISLVTSDALIPTIAEAFQAMEPLVAYLNRGLKGDRYP